MSLSQEKLKQNIKNIYEQAGDAEVIAVTKYVDIEAMKSLYNQGVRLFAENRAQELLEKQDLLGDLNEEIEWHFIGRLQRRPVKDIINRIDYLHSLDRMSLVKEVDKRAEGIIKCFLQVNISQEEQKAGFAVEELEEVIQEIADYPNIEIIGLMTMAPYEAEEDELNHIFSSLKNEQEKIAALNLPYAPCQELSMGMSRDYHLAVAHGATYVRVGSAFFEE
ncbi:MAG: YggS family pyridoxal phosphate-dependent enzyme [Atopococcus tabaci]|uniref:Pyridoxal phosphate homeostasis protein n=1 Tax=Atopococcus tabaci TaxID=269774 RepID=A0AA43UBR9_9LACT|nr:YggS family pyridoxal phosphate-dependent enzyme [Atopococcus tabaci]